MMLTTTDEKEPMATEHLTKYPSAHHVFVPFRTINPLGKKPSPSGEGYTEDRDDPDERLVQQVRTIVIDDKPLCLPMDGHLSIEPHVGGAGHRITVEFFADSVEFEHNPEL